MTRARSPLYGKQLGIMPVWSPFPPGLPTEVVNDNGRYHSGLESWQVALRGSHSRASTTGSQKGHFSVELFCGITPLRARPTRETLRGIYWGPGERRGACRPTHTAEGLLQGFAVTGRAEEHRADGGTT